MELEIKWPNQNIFNYLGKNLTLNFELSTELEKQFKLMYPHHPAYLCIKQH